MCVSYQQMLGAIFVADKRDVMPPLTILGNYAALLPPSGKEHKIQYIISSYTGPHVTYAFYRKALTLT